MSNEYRILMVTSAGPEESVFESQVLDMVRAWRKLGNVSLQYRSRLSKEVKIADVDIKRIFASVPQLSRLLLHGERLLNHQWRWHQNFDLVHCRGAVAAWQVLHSMNKQQRSQVKVLYDCRGIVVEEMEGAWGTSWKSALLPLKMREMRRIEGYVVNEVDILTTVSEGLSDYLEFHYGRRAEQIMRPVVNTDKFSFSHSDRLLIRQKLDLNENGRLFIFVGGGDYWQSLHLLKKWWLSIRRPNTTLLILTHRPSDYDSWLAEVAGGLGVVVVKSVPHHEVSSYMSAADVGVLFRDASLVNNVASPVKLGEYLCTGLQIVTNLAVYKEIQPLDIFVIDLAKSNGSTEYLSRDNLNRTKRAQENKFIFSAEHAVERLRNLAQSVRIF